MVNNILLYNIHSKGRSLNLPQNEDANQQHARYTQQYRKLGLGLEPAGPTLAQNRVIVLIIFISFAEHPTFILYKFHNFLPKHKNRFDFGPRGGQKIDISEQLRI